MEVDSPLLCREQEDSESGECSKELAGEPAESPRPAPDGYWLRMAEVVTENLPSESAARTKFIARAMDIAYRAGIGVGQLQQMVKAGV